ncbi:holo-ACP synthase [Amphibiibacter pelophylacis]|uniref:Holo-ACP synthase n=1 Tax=Amphibiibacter pelophylacis TaxID=1799477 RepID=A0ACC6NYG3_9BURK
MAIVGIGLDLCDPQRVARVLARRGAAFVQRVLGPAERDEYARRSAASPQRGAHYVATRFAAKEALGKALGSGVAGLVAWHDCECLNGPSGAPQWHCHGELARHIAQRGLRLHVSLSDERSLVAAMVVVEGG